MKETERSLRWAFLIAGAIMVLSGLGSLYQLARLLPSSLARPETLPAWYGTFVRVGFGVAFIVAGRGLRRALATGAIWIRRLLLVSGLSEAIEIYLNYRIWGIRLDTPYREGALVGELIHNAFIFFVIAYLYLSVRRMSVEPRAPTTGTAFE